MFDNYLNLKTKAFSFCS